MRNSWRNRRRDNPRTGSPQPIRIVPDIPIRPRRNKAHTGSPPVPVSAQTNFSGPNDRLPLFRGGGLDKFREWFSSRLRYPVGAVSQSIEGRALATFVIERDGSMGEITLLEASDSMFGETVVRLLEKSPKWEPGYLSGEPVRVQFTLPVLFRLSTQREPEPMRSPEWQSRWSCSPGASHRF